jgi:hypothetical protein
MGMIVEAEGKATRVGSPIKKLENVIESQQAANQSLVKIIDGLQARIDELMQEYCPDEMTDNQWDEWEKHQVAVVEAEWTATRHFVEQLD